MIPPAHHNCRCQAVGVDGSRKGSCTGTATIVFSDDVDEIKEMAKLVGYDEEPGAPKRFESVEALREWLAKGCQQ